MFAVKDKKELNNPNNSSRIRLIKLIISIYKKIKFIAKYEFSHSPGESISLGKIGLFKKVDHMLNDYCNDLNTHPEVISFSSNFTQSFQE